MGILSGLFKQSVQSMEKNKDIEGLIENLNHRDINVRRQAAAALGRLGDLRAVEPLISILTDTSIVHEADSLFLQGDVAKALGEIGDERAVKALESSMDKSYSTIAGGFSSLQEAARQAAESKRRIDYFKNAAKEALEKIKAKKR